MTIEANEGSETENKEVKSEAGASNPTPDKFEEFYHNSVRDNAKLRSKNSEYKNQISELEQQARRADELENEVTSLKTSARVEVAQARLEALAIKEGIVDTDALKLIDPKELKFGEDGKPENLADLLNSFKEAKPHFFKEAAAESASTSSVHKMPNAKSSETKSALDMTPEEFAAHKARLKV